MPWKYVLAGLAAVTLSSAAFAQVISHGTFFISAFSSDVAVVAIDSRGTIKSTGKRHINDRFCKIVPLAPSAFFFSAGVATAFHPKTGKVVFDTRDIAKDVYADSGKSRDFAALADTWALRMEAVLRKIPADPSLLKELVTRGYFVGTTDDGRIAAGAETIAYHPDGKSHFVHTPETIALTASPRIEQPADQPVTDIEREFSGGGQTDRARKVMADNGWTKLGQGPDTLAVHLTNLVTAVRDWSGNDKIGGDIATIILERGKPWRWFHRPDFCPEK